MAGPAAALERRRCVWTGFPGGPGVSTFYTVSPTTGFTSALNTFWTALKPYLPGNVTVQIPTAGDVLDPGSGTLTGGWSEGAASTVVMTGAVGYTAPAGLLIRWTTATVVDGRHLMGKTFLVPALGAPTSSGQPATATISAVQAAANALAAAVPNAMQAWSRPRKATAVKPARSGEAWPITGSIVPSEYVVLRSRRD